MGFARDCIAWKPGEGLAGYQEEILAELQERRRASLRGPHGLGKSMICATAVHWFGLTRDVGTDWKVPSTASVWRQLSKFLWPEIHKWAGRLRWDVIGRAAYNTRTELLQLSLKLSTGEAFALASDNTTAIEGAHASSLLYIFDESKAISDGVFDAAEGALSVGDCYALMVSTPGEPLGRFYAVHARKPGFEDWWVRHVRKEELIAAGRMTEAWAEARQRQWGKTSAVYQNRVEGEFASSDADGVIPLAWVEKAIERWHVWHDAPGVKRGKLLRAGVDVGRTGEDPSVLAPLYDCDGLLVVPDLRRWPRQDTMATTGRVVGVLRKQRGAKAVVDVIGLGAGVVDRLRELKYTVVAFNAAARSNARDKSGELEFLNSRAAGWWKLRELLDPDSPTKLALPPDDKLTGDLVAPRWKVTSGGKIQIEDKDELRKRLERSTDEGDAVMMACWEEQTFATYEEELPGFDEEHLRRQELQAQSRPWPRAGRRE